MEIFAYTRKYQFLRKQNLYSRNSLIISDIYRIKMLLWRSWLPLLYEALTVAFLFFCYDNNVFFDG